MSQVILITGASSGFGAMTARALADAGHLAYASMRETAGRNAPQVADAATYAREQSVELRTIELDVASQESVDSAVARIIADTGRIDVIVHNAGHMTLGPSEAFTAEQFADVYDSNVLGTQRVNRAALPYLRAQGQGLLIWVSSTSTRGGVTPWLGPYFAAKAAMDSLAVTYAGELARWGIETSIVSPGAFTKGTNHFKHAGSPADEERAALYEQGPYKGLVEEIGKGLAVLEPPESDPNEVARAIVNIVAGPFGSRPYRVTVDPSHDGAEIVNAMSDRMRAETLCKMGMSDLLQPTTDGGKVIELSQ